MRYSADNPVTAEKIVNYWSKNDLEGILKEYGEEQFAKEIAREIIRIRGEKPILKTQQLVSVIESAVPKWYQKRKIHAATKTFQALRIYVNDELGELARALVAAERVLKPGGRLVVVTFHSLEDRIVKRFFKDRSTQPTASRHLPDVSLRTLTFAASNKAAAATDEEAARNPRARSAKLRLGIRTDAPPRTESDALSFADLPKLADLPETGD